MIDQAVADGYLTQAQADQLKANTFGFGRGGHFGGLYEEDQYLADALGISTDELQSAELDAHAAQIGRRRRGRLSDPGAGRPHAGADGCSGLPGSGWSAVAA